MDEGRDVVGGVGEAGGDGFLELGYHGAEVVGHCAPGLELAVFRAGREELAEEGCALGE